MKDSGVEWIGMIPEEWDSKKAKYIISFTNGYAFESDELLQEGNYPVIRIGDIQDGTINYNDCLFVTSNKGLQNYRIKKDDLLLAMSGATVGKVGISNNDEEAYINQRVGIIRSEVTRFIYYVLLTNNFLEHIELESVGSAQPNISANGVGKFSIPYPDRYEQQLIAEFLDDKVGKIDDILSDLRKQVKTLQKYKKSVITKAVTKGLDISVTMKDSGIDWIGEIPESWSVSKTKYLFEVICGSTPDSDFEDYWDGEIKWITPADMNDFGRISTGNRTITEKGYKSCGTTIVPINSIIISNRAPIGKINLSNELLCTNQGCKCLVNENICNEYFYYFYYANKEELINLGRGTTFKELSTGDLQNFQIIIPTKEEQQEIVDYLNDKCAKIDELIEDKEAQIEKMENYKKSLIFEYVTGKKRVKGAV